MRSAMQYYGLIDASLLSTKTKIEAILENVDDKPNVNDPLWSCHAICRALDNMRLRLGLFEGWDVMVHDGHFHKPGCHHSWLLLTNKMTAKRVICDPLPMGGHGVVYSAQDSSLTPWYGLYLDDAVTHGARLPNFMSEALHLEIAIQAMIDKGLRAWGEASIYA